MLKLWVLGAVLLIGGCSAVAPHEPVPGVISSPAPSVRPKLFKVAITDFSDECAKVRCWLPTQFAPRLVERESVSLEERVPTDPRGEQVGWPLDGDKIEVLCTIKGGTYANRANQSVNDWYRVRVPTEKVEHNTAARAEKAPDGSGVYAYVGISWLTAVEQPTVVPAC